MPSGIQRRFRSIVLKLNFLRTWPPGKLDERSRSFICRHFLYLVEFGLRLLFPALRTPKSGQAVMRVRLGRVEPNRFAKVPGCLVRLVPAGENDPEVQMGEPHVRICC